VFWRHKHECIAQVKTWVLLSQNNLQNGVHLFQKDLNLPETELWFAFRLGESWCFGDFDNVAASSVTYMQG
jgi:hypothetical protein